MRLLNAALQRPRSCRILALLAVAAASNLLIALALLLLSPHLTAPHPPSSFPRFVVSLTSTPSRLHAELPIAVRSLLLQATPPSRIHVYLALPSNASSASPSPPLPSLLRHPTVSVRYVPDRGPATKVLAVLEELLNDSALADVPVVTVDDDHDYSPLLLATLLHFHALQPRAFLGLRGWRIRPDLHWGVEAAELSEHVITGWSIDAPYRVGVVTANEGYLFTASMFLPSRAVLQQSEAPASARWVDDIYINGHLARLGVARFVVPMPSENYDATVTHTLEAVMERHRTSRSAANDETLRFFADAWEKDLWYQRGRNQPPRLSSLIRGWYACSAWARFTLRQNIGWMWMWIYR